MNEMETIDPRELASAPNLQFLTLLHNVTRRSVLQKVQGRT